MFSHEELQALISQLWFPWKLVTMQAMELLDKDESKLKANTTIVELISVVN